MYVGVYLSTISGILPNHGYVELSDIGFTDENALLCLTDLPTCCTDGTGSWYDASGASIGSQDSSGVPGFYTNRSDQVIRLIRYNDTSFVEGIYYCEVPDSNNTTLTVYVGLYNSGGGM